ncbi:MAG: hypothetical protein NT031_13025, partial [Planctomycetota bacterium]|nr:hypothetical protein [Planctomycetota bacterium]
MHGLVPALAFLVSECGGYVVGYRGDGLIAAFGIDEFAHEKAISDNGRFVQEAACCGQAMLETVDGIVNILLEAWKIPGDVRIGVGIDVGQ